MFQNLSNWAHIYSGERGWGGDTYILDDRDSYIYAEMPIFWKINGLHFWRGLKYGARGVLTGFYSNST